MINYKNIMYLLLPFIVILGTITAGQRYDMHVLWNDYRNGILSNEFVVHSELSNKPVSPLFDYNVVSGGYKELVTLSYGRNAGYP